MKSRRNYKEKRRYHRHSITLILEYWDTYGSRHGGLAGNVSGTGLLIYSIQDMTIGSQLNLKVFFSNGYELDSFNVIAKAIWKELHCEKGWQGYKYGLEFIQISQEDQRKLLVVLDKRSQAGDLCRYLFRKFKKHRYSDESSPQLSEST